MSSCRQRKIICPECGYTLRGTRSWMLQGLPTCPCGEAMRPDSPADMAFCDLITFEHVSPAEWTAICRENGWEDSIIRKGAAAKAWERKQLASGGIMGRKRSAAHCANPGCGRWIADGAERCTAGHAQHKDAPELDENMGVW